MAGDVSLVTRGRGGVTAVSAQSPAVAGLRRTRARALFEAQKKVEEEEEEEIEEEEEEEVKNAVTQIVVPAAS